MTTGLVPAGAITQETLELAKQAFADPRSRIGPGLELKKAGINIAENLVGINLEAPSKKLFPVYSPLRNRFARVKSPVGASAVQWRSILKINKDNVSLGVAENTRNSFVTTETESKTAAFVSLGLDDYVGFEALSRSKGFEDVRATAAVNLLYAVMIGEECVILGGQATNIGPVGTVTGTANVGTGSLAAGTYIVSVSALTLCRGFKKAEKAAGVAEADGETTATNSAGVAIAGPTDSIDVAWPALKGAVAYNVFMDDGAAGAKRFVKTVFTNRTNVAAYPGAGAAPNTLNKSGSALEFTGVIGQIETDANLPAAHFKSLDDATLTSDGAGGIVEFDDILKSMWDNFRLGPTAILVNSAQSRDVTKKIGSSSNLAYRIYLQDGQRNVVGGIYVGSYLNKYASSFAEGFPNEVPIKIHPDLPTGTIVFIVESLPYPSNQVPNVWEIEALQEYTQYEWALASRRYEFGIYFQEVLKGYYSRAQAVLVCVKEG